MIAWLKGRIHTLKPTEIILDAGGVGYHLAIPLSTYAKINALNETSLFVYTLHREDQFKLYGFFTEQEKGLFSLLLNISGIGPSIALSILSGISPALLSEAVKNENPESLMRIPGIGKTKAEKLIFELKRKIAKLEDLAGEAKEEFTPATDAVNALVSLGFDESRSAKAVREIIRQSPETSLENIIKEALKIL